MSHSASATHGAVIGIGIGPSVRCPVCRARAKWHCVRIPSAVWLCDSQKPRAFLLILRSLF